MSFISFSCLIAQSRFSGTMLTKSDDSGHSCLVFDLIFILSPLCTVLAVGLSYVAFIILKHVLYILNLLSF